jgi:predicted TPR repeat methyltransferase
VKARYDLIADHWIHARQNLPPLDRALIDAFRARLPAQARVLDLGCGTGHPIGTLLAAQGCLLHGIDRSAALLAEARRNLPHASFAQAELEDCTIGGPWHGVVCFDVLFHLPRSTHDAILQRVLESLTPGGMLVLTSGGSANDAGPFTDTMFGVEFFYDAFPRDELVSRCEALGYRVETRVMLNEPDGARDKGRLGLLLAKPGPS